MNIKIKDGNVYKDGEQIATITGDVITSHKALGPTVKGAIKRERPNASFAFSVGQVGPENVSEGKEMSDAELLAEMKRRGLVIAPVAESAKVLSPAEQAQRDEMPIGMVEKIAIFERLNDQAKKGKIPQPPVKHPALGVKTPAFVDWVKNHATAEEFELVYPPDRRLPTIEAFNEGEAKRKRIQTETTDSKEDRGEA